MFKKLNVILLGVLILNCFGTLLAVADSKIVEPKCPEFRKLERKPIKNVSELAVEIENFYGEYLTENKSSESTVWNIEPVIFRTGEAIEPGEVFYLYGEGLIRKEMEIKLAVSDTAVPSKLPPEDAYTAEIIQIDENAQFVCARLPYDITPETYFVWVKNEYGWSDAVKLNDARAVFLQENDIALGQTNRVYGKNLVQSEWGGAKNSKVVIANQTHAYEVPVYDVNPFCIEFGIPKNVIPGEYEVFASNNDGINYTKVSYYKSNKLTVRDTVKDPFELNVGWAGEFEYDLVLDVEDFGAVGDRSKDDLPAIQAAIDKCAELGGGIVYIPNGNYSCIGEGTIYIRDHVILMGESKEGTILYDDYAGADKSSKIFVMAYGNSKSIGSYGFNKLTLKNETVDLPDTVMWLGNDWGARNEYRKIAKHIFIKDVGIETQVLLKGKGRGIGVVAMADSHIIIDGLQTHGNTAEINSAYVDYFQIKNCDTYSLAAYQSAIGVCQTIENNNIYRYGTDYYYVSNLSSGVIPKGTENPMCSGIFSRGPAYVAGNTLNHLGTNISNSGEAICTELAGGGTKIYGKVLSSTNNTMIVQEIDTKTNKETYNALTGNGDVNTLVYDWNFKKPYWGDYLTVTIVKGKGMGQHNYIVSGNPQTRTLELMYDWKIKPDATSVFVVNVISECFIIYNNDTTEATKGYWLYGDTNGCVVSQNRGSKMEGALIHSAMNRRKPSFRLNYFDRIDKNTFNGTATEGERVGGITMTFDVAYSETEDVMLNYGITVYDNNVQDAKNTPLLTQSWISEAPDRSGIAFVFVGERELDHNYLLSKAINISDNVVNNSEHGLSLGGYYSRDGSGAKGPHIGYVFVEGNSFTENDVNFVYDQIPHFIMKDNIIK